MIFFVHSVQYCTIDMFKLLADNTVLSNIAVLFSEILGEIVIFLDLLLCNRVKYVPAFLLLLDPARW